MTGTLEKLADALRAEDQARGSIRDARRRQADAFRELQRAGMPGTTVALRVARLLGRTVSISERRRLAELLRKRADRTRTSCPADLAVSHGLSGAKHSPCDRAISPDHTESDMARLVKRVVTEEYLEKREDEDLELEDLELGDEEVDDEHDEEGPAPRRRRK
jgi:hypothetical protein